MDNELNDFRQNVKKLWDKGVSQRKIAKQLGKSKSAVSRAMNWLKSHDTEAPIIPSKQSIEKSFQQNTACITTKSLNIQTLDEALEASDVDLDVWEVDRYIINSWEVTIGASAKADRPETYTNYQVKVWLKRKVKEIQEAVLDELIESIRKDAPKYMPIKRIKSNDPHLLEICLFDHHFGLMAWNEETGNDYDLKIAKDFYLRAVENLLNQIGGHEVERILIPFGNDFFHVNDQLNATPKNKNHLDVDSRMAKIFATGEMAMLKAIDMCREIAPVDVLWIPGNHDPETSYFLAKVLSAHHDRDVDVQVDCGPKVRKSYIYGKNFIGFAHGDCEPVKELPRIFMDEYTSDWANTKYREIHIGHIHKKKQTNFVSVDSVGSTSVRVIPSLCGTDAWHYAQGYVRKDKAAQSFLWHGEKGLVGSFLTHL